jgi:hypothetical protein
MNARQRASSFVATVLLIMAAPAFAHACPMCFNGNNQNQSAFLYGSIMLMLVPTITIGSLVYWAWRRACANAAAQEQLPPPPPPSEALLPQAEVEQPALRAVGHG